jgi:hypothetical protein
MQIFTSAEIEIEDEISEKLRLKFNLPGSEVNKILFDFSTNRIQIKFIKNIALKY